MNIFDVEKACVGCAGCIDACPVDALVLAKDLYGFFVPKLKKDKCISCGKCVKMCPVIEKGFFKREPAYFYGWSKVEEVRASSSSGGIFRSLADYVLRQNGVVFGARYSEDFYSVTMDSTENVSIEELQRSKYVQANATGVYSRIKDLLKQGKKVLLTGTPCQIAAARKQFGDEENLILVDFLCGGVPSPDCYMQYIQWLEKKFKSKVVNVNFRDKKNGWTRSSIRVLFENQKMYFSSYEYDPYYALFYMTPFMKNEACLDCKFTSDRFSDLTIADFWGFRKAKIPNDDKGMSLVVAHTSKGKDVIMAMEKVELIPLEEKYGNYDFVPKKNSEEKRKKREMFLQNFIEVGFIEAICKDFYKYRKMGVFLRKCKRRMVKILRALR